MIDAAGSAHGSFGIGSPTTTTGNYWRPTPIGYGVERNDTGTGTVASGLMLVGNSSGSGSPSSQVFSILLRAKFADVSGLKYIYGGVANAIGLRLNAGAVDLIKVDVAAIGIASTTLSANVWYHLAVTYDGAAARYYLDGRADGTGSSAQTFDLAQQHAWFARQDGGVTNNQGNGTQFAAMSVWNRPLSPSEIWARYVNPWCDFVEVGRRIFTPSAAAGQSATVNQATETDLAQAIARSKAKLLGQTTETDLAQAISQLKRAALGQVAETDTAQAITTAKRVQLGQVTETDLAQAITAAAANQVVQVTETDTAQALTARKTLALGQPAETDTAQAIARAKAKELGQTTETDTAQAVAHAKAKLLGQVTETDLAQTVTPSVPNQLGQATETDISQVVTPAKAKQLGQVTETDAAQAVSRLKTATVNLALEIDIGQPITWAPKIRILGQVLETDLAQPIAGALASTVLPQGKLFTVGARTGFVVGPRSGFRVDQ